TFFGVTSSFASLLPFDLVLVFDCVDSRSCRFGFGLFEGLSSWRSLSFRFLLLAAEILVGWSGIAASLEKASARSLGAGWTLRFRVEVARGAREVGCFGVLN